MLGDLIRRLTMEGVMGLNMGAILGRLAKSTDHPSKLLSSNGATWIKGPTCPISALTFQERVQVLKCLTVQVPM